VLNSGVGLAEGKAVRVMDDCSMPEIWQLAGARIPKMRMRRKGSRQWHFKGWLMRFNFLAV
jgi:hypothetical protein